MATVPTMSTVSAGGIGTAALWNSQVRDLGNFFISVRPRAILRQTVTQTLTHAVWAPVTFDVEDLDNDSAHSTSTNTSRYTVVTAGYYRVGGGASFASNGTGARFVRWAINNAAVTGSASGSPAPAAGTGASVAAMSRELFLNVGDYLELQAFQNSGGNLATLDTAEQACVLELCWLSS